MALHSPTRPTSPWPDSVYQSFRPKKRLGQHSLVNRGVLQQVLTAADILPTDTIIEVGPGTGILTRELAKQARAVIAVELDRGLAAHLQAELQTLPHVQVVQGDILAWPPERLLGEVASADSTAPAGTSARSYKVVANLPYYITAPVLRHFLASPCPPSRMVVMVQYEVAKSIVARPGQLSLLAIAVQFYGQPSLVARVSPDSFRPAPQVHSAILCIETYQQPPVDVPSVEAFFDAVRAGFSARRKQLRNALVNAWHISSEEATRLLDTAGIDPQRRAQTLTLAEWARLAHARYDSRETR